MAKKFRKAKPGAVCEMDAEGNVGRAGGGARSAGRAGRTGPRPSG